MAMRWMVVLLIMPMFLWCGRASGDASGSAKSESAKSEKSGEAVFLLHGIGKGSYDMYLMGRSLKRAGYEVVNWEYPSTHLALTDIADELHGAVSKYEGRTVHFVTHSMGGIVARTYLSRHCPERMGRLVMIAPPSQGAHLADVFGDWLLYKMLFGPAGQELRQGENGSCAAAGIPACEFGIIAGGTGKAKGLNPLLPGDNDGTVTVDSTKLEGAADFALVPHAHPVIQMAGCTQRLALEFLETGSFNGITCGDPKEQRQAVGG